MDKVGDPSISPYLLQRLRSINEAKDARAQRQPEPDAPQPADQTPASDPAGNKTAMVDPAKGGTEAGEKPPDPSGSRTA